MKVSVIGCGRWGSFITWYLSSNGHDVIEYGREDGASYQILKTTGKNKYVTLNKSVKLTCNLSDVFESDIIIISVLSQSLRAVLNDLKKLGLGE